MRSQSGVSALVLAAAALCPVLGGCGDEAIDLNPPVMMQQQGLCGGMPAQILTGNSYERAELMMLSSLLQTSAVCFGDRSK